MGLVRPTLSAEGAGMTSKKKKDIRLFVVAALTGAIGLAMLLSLVPQEKRDQLVEVWEEDRRWHTRPARVVELDCLREERDGASPCREDGRFEILYEYRYGDREFQGSRIAPDYILNRIEPREHEQMLERFRHAKLHSRPFTIHLNQANPEDAYIYPPEPVWGPTISLWGGGVLMLVSLVTLVLAMRRV
ncbi:MAG: DUF3592 domain-containing protein [Halomonadaceae bacterium]|nr:MAG: DUF3592 domain-containing protein [Halomonadaceae bacterium]